MLLDHKDGGDGCDDDDDDGQTASDTEKTWTIVCRTSL